MLETNFPQNPISTFPNVASLTASTKVIDVIASTSDFNIKKNICSSNSKLYSGKDLLNLKVSEIPMLFDKLIPMVGTSMLVGASDTGKSMLLRQMGMSVACGKPFLNHAYNGKNKRCLVVSSEDDEMAIAFLLDKQNGTMMMTQEEAENIQFIFDTSDLVKTLDEALTANSTDLVIVDSLGDVFDGKDLNQNSQVRPFLNQYSQLAVKHKCSVCFLHHTGKRTEDSAPSKNNSIGSQGIEAKARLVIELRQDKINPSQRHLCIVKGNYLPAEAKTSSYVLKMDENFCFSDTGNRVDFDKLISGKTCAKVPKVPQSYDDSIHKEFLKEIFKPFDKKFSGNQFDNLIQTKFEVSDKPSRGFLTFYQRKGWVRAEMINARSTLYSMILGESSIPFDYGNQFGSSVNTEPN